MMLTQITTNLDPGQRVIDIRWFIRIRQVSLLNLCVPLM